MKSVGKMGKIEHSKHMHLVHCFAVLVQRQDQHSSLGSEFEGFVRAAFSSKAEMQLVCELAGTFF
jgi:hypothetical protein